MASVTSEISQLQFVNTNRKKALTNESLIIDGGVFKLSILSGQQLKTTENKRQNKSSKLEKLEHGNI